MKNRLDCYGGPKYPELRLKRKKDKPINEWNDLPCKEQKKRWNRIKT